MVSGSALRVGRCPTSVPPRLKRPGNGLERSAGSAAPPTRQSFHQLGKACPMQNHLRDGPSNGSKMEVRSLQRDGHGHSNCFRGAVARYPSDFAGSALFLCAGSGRTRRRRRQPRRGWAFWRPLFRRTFGLEPWWWPLRLAALLVEKALGPGCGIGRVRDSGLVLVTAVERGRERAIPFANSANLSVVATDIPTPRRRILFHFFFHATAARCPFQALSSVFFLGMLF
jgi:hypothetical protein